MNDMQIRVFLSAAKYNSFNKAAKVLFVSQPTVSRNIRELEEEFAVTLFSRNSARSTLTPAGEVLYHFLEDCSHSFEEVLRLAQRIHSDKIGTLRLDLLDGQMMNPTIQRAIHLFEKRFPEVELILRRNDYEVIRRRLKEGVTDCAELPQDSVAMEGLEAFPIYDMDPYLIVSIYSYLATKESIDLEEALPETLLITQSDEQNANATIWQWISACREANIEEKILRVRDIGDIQFQVELNKGVTIANKYHHMANGSLTKAIPIKGMGRKPFVLLREAMNPNPFVKELLRCIQESK